MKLKTLIVLVLMLSLTYSGLAAYKGAIRSYVDENRGLELPALTSSCTMNKAIGSHGYYWDRYEAGIGVYTYFDPEIQCGAPAYPFEITDFAFTLFEPGITVWPVTVDVIVYDLVAGSNACDGPGEELCRFQITADEYSFKYPAMGMVPFPSPCCVDGPFFIGLQYLDGQIGSTPSIFLDTSEPDTCDNWVYDGSAFSEWSDFWGFPVPGYPLFQVYGESVSQDCLTLCSWNPGDDHKMHFPQYPDEDGYDVNATMPVTLADDFMCMNSGAVNDIHFWGAWKNDIEGKIAAFYISFHADIPADPPAVPFSRPGEILWERVITDFTETKFNPASRENWYDASLGEAIGFAQADYWQYDICFDLADPALFIQDSGIIYWISISAVIEDPESTQWGWKSTAEHWNDDAVWAFREEFSWIDLREPFSGGSPYVPGDVNADENINQDDVIAISDLLYMATPPASWSPDGSFFPAADVNGDCIVEIADLAGLQAFVNNGIPVPLYCPQYPPGDGQQSLDLAFVISGGFECDCRPGDANWDGNVNVGDAVYIISYVFKGGPPPTPYRICSGDANCDCQVNVGDAVYHIAYVFKFGPPPCRCNDWLLDCGAPLRK